MASIEVERYVTTVGGKRYMLNDKQTPQLWAVEIRIKCVDHNDSFQQAKSYSVAETVFVERNVLEDHGLLPRPKTNSKQESEQPPPNKTAEDLILELLELVGVYPDQ